MAIVHQEKNDSTSDSRAFVFSWYMLTVEKKLPGQRENYGEILQNAPYEKRISVTSQHNMSHKENWHWRKNLLKKQILASW